MNARNWLHAVVLLASGLLAPRLQAQLAHSEACDQVGIAQEGSFAPRWLDPIEELCSAVPEMPDRDPSAELRLVAAGEDVIVEVSLADGRSTLRRVRTPHDLHGTVEALLIIPSLEAAPAPAEQAPAPATPLIVEAPRARPENALPAQPQRNLHLELGLAFMGRLSGAPTYLSAGLYGYAGVVVDRWLLGLSARWHGYETVIRNRPPLFEMSTAGGGFLLLRRVKSLRSLAVDVGATTWLLSETQSYQQTGGEKADSSMDVRLGTLARILWGKHLPRWCFSLDAELSPGRLTRDLRLAPGLPRLPAWSIGCGVGIVWVTS